jgi:hypothetical protein
MADHMAAEIHIGGKVPRSVAQALCKVVTDTQASLEWGGAACDISTPEDLLSSRSVDGDEPNVLKLYDDEARWGEFETLEAFLQEHGIPYCRWSDGRYEYDAEAVAFNPNLGLLHWLTDHEQNGMVRESKLRPIVAKLEALVKSVKRGGAEARQALAGMEETLAALQAELPPQVPPLETLEIAEGRSCPTTTCRSRKCCPASRKRKKCG